MSERVDALEMRVAYQDDTIETLNQTITAQWQQIDALTRQLAELRDRLQDAERNAPARSTNPRRIIKYTSRRRSAESLDSLLRDQYDKGRVANNLPPNRSPGVIGPGFQRDDAAFVGYAAVVHLDRLRMQREP